MLGCWEEFDDGPTPPRESRMRVTLSLRSVIHMNGNVYEKLGKPGFVRLFFDRLNSRIGILPTVAGMPKAFPVKTKGKGRDRIIWASPFCKKNGIQFSRIRAFVEPEIDDEGMLSLNLLNTTMVGRSQNRER
jgi:hypothetical protein